MEMEKIHGISINPAKIHKICDFCVTETHETAECTKPYESLLQISGFEPRTTFFMKCGEIPPISIKKWVIRENSTPGRRYRSQNLMKHNTFTASREIHPGVRFQLSYTFSHET